MTLGGALVTVPRPDVGAYFGAQLSTTGFNLLAPTLPPGMYRTADPDFESAISTFAEAEAESAAEDPVAGQTTRAKR